MLSPLPEIHWTDLIDVVLVGAVLWAVIVWLRRARARLVLLGLAVPGLTYLLARRFELQLTAWLLQGFFAVLVIVLVIVFQEDLKRLFERLAVWGLGRRGPAPSADGVDVLVRAVFRLTAERVGALIVLPGREPLDRHLEGGVVLDGKLSLPLLLSLFDPHSPGHDGAILIAGQRVVAFAVHLPLSTHLADVGAGGTRHAAALGLAERSDAFCLVVSEERGVVSVAHRGRLRQVSDAEDLEWALRSFLAEVPKPAARAGWSILSRHGLEGLLAFALAVILWVMLVPGSGVVAATRSLPVTVDNLPPGYVLESVDPVAVEVTFEGPRRYLFLSDPETVEVRIDADLARLGRRTFQVTPEAIKRPENVRVINIRPPSVKLDLERTTVR